MAGSRIEKFSNIFSRVEGLIRSGAMKYDDKPIWFNVYRAYPPKHQPKFNREPVPNERVVNLLYPEDLIRAKFYSVYGSPKIQVVTDLTDDKTPTVCQRFIDKYIELKKSKVIKNEKLLFETTANFLKTQGVILKSGEEITKEEHEKERFRKETSRTIMHQEDHQPFSLSARDIFGEKIVSSSNTGTDSDSANSDDDET